MICSKVQTLLSAYLDRELNGSEMLAVREHLRECECCRHEEEALRSIKLILCGSPIEGPSSDFEDRLCSKVMAVAAAESLSFRQRPGIFGRIYASIISTRSRMGVVYALGGLTVGAVAIGVFFVARPKGAEAPMANLSGTQSSLTNAQFGVAQPGASVAKKPKSEKRYLDLIDRDNAYITSADPLSGPQVALAASYGNR